jgi:hypothetical protein
MDLLEKLNNMITAEEFLIENKVVGMTDLIASIMIEFAKLHVEMALKEAKWRCDDTTNSEGLGEYVLNSYPESNIT